jgi:hypothetical protein
MGKKRTPTVKLEIRKLSPYWDDFEHHVEDAKKYGVYYIMISDTDHEVEVPGEGWERFDTDEFLQYWTQDSIWENLVRGGRTIHESVNFERGKDPKEAMGIGKPSWDNVKVGDLFRCVKYTRTGEAWYPGGDREAGHEGITIYSTPGMSGYQFEPGDIYIITDIEPYDKDPRKLEIWAPNIEWGNGPNRIVATPRQLSNRFELLNRAEIEGVEREYPGKIEYWTRGIKESYNFERGKDPKETMKIGKAANPFVIEFMEEEYDEEGRVDKPLPEDHSHVTWMESCDAHETHYVLNNWKQAVDGAYYFYGHYKDTDYTEHLHAPEINDEYVEYNGELYYIPDHKKFWDMVY